MTNPSYPLFHPLRADRPRELTVEAFTAEFPSESRYVEWKSGTGGAAIQKAIVAFSNADGGVLLLGVDDRGWPTGMPFTEGLEQKLWEIVNQVESPGNIALNSLRVGSVEITVISIAKGQQGVALTSSGTVLIRRGKQNLPLKSAGLAELVSQRVHESFDGSPSPWSLADADPALLDQFCQAFGIDQAASDPAIADALEERGMLVRRVGGDVLTKSGALFLVPAAPDAFGKCFVEVFRFQQGAVEHDRRIVFKGTPAQQVDDATAWIDEELGFDLVVVGVKRHDLRRLPVKALREAIANAVAHRDYQLAGSAVEVRITPNEVVVVSPGGFVAPVTSENLRNAHAARNRRVLQSLRAFGLAEDAGRGIEVILAEMAADLRSEPIFEEQPPGHVMVRLPIESPVSPEERAWVIEQESRSQLRPADRRVLIEAARGRVLTNAMVRSLLNVDNTAARGSLQRLRDAGFLEQDGERGGTRYRIAPGARRPAGVGLSRAELRSAIFDMAAGRALTNSMVQSETGLSRNETSVLLRELVADGLLEMRGTKRGSYYVATGSSRTP